MPAEVLSARRQANTHLDKGQQPHYLIAQHMVLLRDHRHVSHPGHGTRAAAGQARLSAAGQQAGICG